MKFEHFALNVPDAPSHAGWYVENLGFSIRRAMTSVPFTHFLADDTGRVVVEFYTNAAAEIPDYRSRHPLVFHFAVVAEDASSVRKGLETEGAVFAYEDRMPDGSKLIMMRDPWGVPLQVCQRSEAL